MESKNMPAIIPLANRYCKNTRLELSAPGVYYYVYEPGTVYYIRTIFKENDKDIDAIDPDGGPMISVGSKIAGLEIKRISFDSDNCLWKIEVE